MLDRPVKRIAGRYQLVRLLGKGGMGAVWVARDEALHRDVAVKEVMLPAELDERSRAELCERTVREARAAARLRHPAIVKVHDVVSDEGRPWIVMELLRGRTVQDLVRSGEPLPPERVARLGAELLGALAVAHEQRIQHRDVKPANVFLCEDGRVVLTDFGIARMEGQVTITGSGMLIGSPGYIAPERLRGERGGPLSDVWSLGATLYAAVEGVAPFRAESSVAVLHQVLTQDAPPPSRAGAALGPVLLRMLAYDPADRPDVATAARWLQDVAGGTPATLPPLPTPSPRPAPHPGTPDRAAGGAWQKAVAVVATIAGLAMVAGLAWYGTARHGGQPAVAAPADTRSSPTVTAPITPTIERGRFTLPVEFCTLLTNDQAKRIAPGRTLRKGPSDDGCSWSTRGVGFMARPLSPHRRGDYWEANPAEAHEGLINYRNLHAKESKDGRWLWGAIGMKELMAITTSAARKVDGIGDEAYACDVRDRDTGTPVYTEVRFRVDNLLVEVWYADLRPGESGRIRDTAEDLARIVANRLKNGG